MEIGDFIAEKQKDAKKNIVDIFRIDVIYGL